MWCISIGLIGSLNYVKIDENTVSIYYLETQILPVTQSDKTEKYKNRFGYGAFLDMELKQVLFKRLSVYSRVEVDDVSLVNSYPRGFYFLKTDYTSLEFMLGVRFNLIKE